MAKKSSIAKFFEDKLAAGTARVEFAEAKRRAEDVGGIRTVCMVLGPYRNLTTLTASVVFMHPNIQVLNHGASRIFPIEEANFFSEYTDEKFVNFLRFCLYLSGGGKRGKHGGSITLSHAFEKDILGETYRARYGESTVKDDIRCLFWKESMRVTNLIRHHGIDLADLFARNAQLRFILPIRNPIDSAISNRKEGHVQHFQGLEADTLEATIDFIVEEIAWFLDQEKAFPGRFFHFGQNDVDRATLGRLAAFLGVEPEERWIADSLTCWKLKGSYEVAADVKAAYRASVEKHMARHPEMQGKLLAFA